MVLGQMRRVVTDREAVASGLAVDVRRMATAHSRDSNQDDDHPDTSNKSDHSVSLLGI